MTECPRPAAPKEPLLLEFSGIIIRRSCMGKKLSFCDIQLDNDPHERDTESSEEQDILKVTFQRDSDIWNANKQSALETTSNSPFPIKASDLPYGARVQLKVQPRADGGGTTSSNIYQVASWRILNDPKEAAETIAKQGQRMDGISYSTYLRERGNRFAEIKVSNNMKTQPNITKKRPRINSDDDNKNHSGSKIPDSKKMKNDDLEGHGDKQAKAMRARLFAKWILDKFGQQTLQQGSGVLDIAGGKGQLSVELAASGQVPCTVVDPLIRKQQHSFPVKRDAKRIRKTKGPLPKHLPTFFNQTDFLEKYGIKEKDANKTKMNGFQQSVTEGDAYEEDDESSQQDHSTLVTDASCLVGLHPDQSTQDILEISLLYNKNCAIVPCCVFPSFFPMRQLQNGSPVVTHSQFVQYLMEKDSSLKQETLPFEGRNLVLYRKVEYADESEKLLAKDVSSNKYTTGTTGESTSCKEEKGITKQASNTTKPQSNTFQKGKNGPRIVINVQDSFECDATGQRRGSISKTHTKNKPLYVFVTAHPDDESMFFLPSINALLQAGETVWLLCLTTGNYDGLGDRRKAELSRVCSLLKLHKLICLDHKEMQDHPTESWSLDVVTSQIEIALQTALEGREDLFEQIVLITFDSHGVSGHINHRDTYRGVRNFVSSQQAKEEKARGTSTAMLPPVVAWQLESAQFLPAKYVPIAGWVLILLYLNLLWKPFYEPLPNIRHLVGEQKKVATSLQHVYRSVNPLLSWKAMATHESQFVWYRRLFVVFSCYTFVNKLRPIQQYSK